MASEVESHFKGYARMRLDNLHLESNRGTDEKNVKRLLRIYRVEGYHNCDPMHDAVGTATLLKTGQRLLQ